MLNVSYYKEESISLQRINNKVDTNDFGSYVIKFISYLSYKLHCCTLPDKRCLSHNMCLYQVMMTFHILNDVLMTPIQHKNRKLLHNR